MAEGPRDALVSRNSATTKFIYFIYYEFVQKVHI